MKMRKSTRRIAFGKKGSISPSEDEPIFGSTNFSSKRDSFVSKRDSFSSKRDSYFNIDKNRSMWSPPSIPSLIERLLQESSSKDTHSDIQDHTLKWQPPKEKKRSPIAQQVVSGKLSDIKYSVEDVVEFMGVGPFQLKLFFICGLFSATDALEMLLLSVLSPVLRCEWHLSEFKVALITTVVFIGMFVGSNFWGSASDKYGRFPIMFMASISIAYFGILTSLSPTYTWILILRGLVGFWFGGAIQAFTLMAEYMPSKWRAKILIVYNLMWAVGSCSEIVLARYIIPTLGWRYLVGVSALPMIMTSILVWRLPESARFLVAAGKNAEAQRTLEKACAMNGVTLPKGELLEPYTHGRGNFFHLFNKKTKRTTLQLWLLWFGVAFSYYGAILLNSNIFQVNTGCVGVTGEEEEELCKCKWLTKDDYNDMVFTTFGEFFAIPLNIIIIDTLGRRWTIAINLIGAGTFFLLIQICSPRVVLTLFLFAIRGFASGLFNILYIYTSEVFPTSLRSIGLGSCSGMARLGAMVTPFIAEVALRYSFKGSIWVYGAVCVFSAVNAVCMPIETKGRELMGHLGYFDILYTDSDPETDDECQIAFPETNWKDKIWNKIGKYFHK